MAGLSYRLAGARLRGPAPHSTVTVAVMKSEPGVEWNLQKYWNVPGAVNVNEKVWSFPRPGLSHLGDVLPGGPDVTV